MFFPRLVFVIVVLFVGDRQREYTTDLPASTCLCLVVEEPESTVNIRVIGIAGFGDTRKRPRTLATVLADTDDAKRLTMDSTWRRIGTDPTGRQVFEKKEVRP